MHVESARRVILDFLRWYNPVQVRGSAFALSAPLWRSPVGRNYPSTFHPVVARERSERGNL